MSDWDHFRREAELLRDLHDCGAVLLTRGRSAGFSGRQTVKRTSVYPVSPGGGGPPADFDYMRYDETEGRRR